LLLTAQQEFKSACCDVLDSVKLKSIVYGPTQAWKTKHANAISNDGRDRVYKLGKKAKAEEDAEIEAAAAVSNNSGDFFGSISADSYDFTHDEVISDLEHAHSGIRNGPLLD
jgi:hypothetical protein